MLQRPPCLFPLRRRGGVTNRLSDRFCSSSSKLRIVLKYPVKSRREDLWLRWCRFHHPEPSDPDSEFCEQLLLLLIQMMVCLWQQHIFKYDTVFSLFSSYWLSCDVLVVWQLGSICWLYLLFKLLQAAAQKTLLNHFHGGAEVLYSLTPVLYKSSWIHVS